MIFVLKILLPSLVLLIAFLHLYWGHGGVWPGVNKQDLIDKVYGRGTKFPSMLACYGVAMMLMIAALIPYLDHAYSAILSLSVAFVFLLRGIGGYIIFRKGKWGPKFIHYNRRYFSPLCIFLGVGYLLLGFHNL